MGMAIVEHNISLDRTSPSSSAVGSHTNRRAIPQHLVDVMGELFKAVVDTCTYFKLFPVISCKMIKYLCLLLDLIFLMFEVIGRAAFFLVIGWVSSFVVVLSNLVLCCVAQPVGHLALCYASRPV